MEVMQEIRRRKAGAIWLRAAAPKYARGLALVLLAAGLVAVGVSYWRLRGRTEFRMISGPAQLSTEVVGEIKDLEHREMKGDKLCPAAARVARRAVLRRPPRAGERPHRSLPREGRPPRHDQGAAHGHDRGQQALRLQRLGAHRDARPPRRQERDGRVRPAHRDGQHHHARQLRARERVGPLRQRPARREEPEARLEGRRRDHGRARRGGERRRRRGRRRWACAGGPSTSSRRKPTSIR